jgi:uncharacterized protein (DUF362 family)
MSSPSPIHSPVVDSRVGIVRLPAATYPLDDTTGGPTPISAAVAALGDMLGWSDADRGAFGSLIARGSRVLVKPNWVLHENQGPWGIEPLVTHGSLIHAVVNAALAADPAQVLVGDAPVQGCDFEQLLARSAVPQWAEPLAAADPRFAGVRDFRRTRTTRVGEGGARVTERDDGDLDRFVLFDLGAESLLEPITDGSGSFRVTMYPPAEMQRTHAPGRHQYLVARDVIEADVIINLPKLKTHKKAGITCALKNLIGINGNKEFLPHHRIGGSQDGGDCYPGHSIVKRSLEATLDVQNSTDNFVAQRALATAARLLNRVAVAGGDQLGVEGSWSGNDTIWRTCLDLNRILLYGRADGTLADVPQRQVVSVVDAVIAGQGDGPLAPEPHPLGLLLAGASSAAVDWVGAHLLGYDPHRIPIAREAFGQFRYPLVEFRAEDVSVLGDLGHGIADELLPGLIPTPKHYPLGWLDAIAVTAMM